MTRSGSIRAAVAGGLLVAAQAASAQVTPEEVWASYESWFAAFGFDVEATTEASDGALRVSDIVLRLDLQLPELGASLSVAVPYPEMTLAEEGDGAVLITSPSEFAGQITASAGFDFGFGEPEMAHISLDLAMRSQDESIFVSGGPDDMIFHSIARMLDVVIDNPRVLTPDLPGEDLDFDFSLGVTIIDNDMVTRVRQVDGGTRLDFENTSGRTIISVTTEYGYFDWWEGEMVTLLSRDISVAEATAATGHMVLPADIVPNLLNLAPYLRAGFEFDYRSSTVDQIAQSVSYEDGILFTEEDLRYGTVRQQFDLSGGTLGMSVEAADLSLEIRDNVMPPWEAGVSVSEIAFSLVWPLLESPEVQSAQSRLLLKNLTGDDAIWREVDFIGLLPRDPISAELDLNVQLLIRQDLLDFLALFDMSNLFVDPRYQMSPIDVMGIEAETIRFEGLGITFDADGSLAFPEGMLSGRMGMPLQPVGQTRFELTGINGLLDALVELGEIWPGDARDLRMGLALIGRTTGDDTITSEVEFTEDGRIIANGQQIQ